MLESLFIFIDQVVSENIADKVQILVSTLLPLLGAAVTLYILYLAYQSLYEPQNMVIMETMKLIGSLAAVTTIALNTDFYLSYVVPALMNSGDDLAQALLGNNSGAGVSLQSMFDKMINQIQLIWEGAKIKIDVSWGSVEGLDTIKDFLLRIVLLLLVLLGFVPFLAVATAYLLIAKIMMSFLIIIGPLFIMMSFFPSTRSFFQAWTGQCFNYTLLCLMYPIAFTIFIQVLEATVFSAPISMATHLITIIIFFSLILLSVQIPSFCSTLSGGVGISGLVGGAMGSLGGMRSAAKGAVGGVKGAKAGLAYAKNKIGGSGKGSIKPG
ncbi:type IV secretion system protein [Vibrio sp. SS-MA-C1-2]|uniref:type IV secretion system protein n=1 Tax=Vibrio sp. SS-MA-C1-2 TaxID=2908646 RepID=UPI001F343050|nr:type IV secretion system protein [Vibrio sp. SS-MA-C1-2]UJF17253.1 type IV secretion system protein [Vibrio sp. SS-MA-C1-2]